jgi:hypothetical protein
MARLARIAVCMALGFFAAALAAAASAKYRIEMSDGRQILATDLPVARGSVLTFHPYPAGPLTGVPTEMIVRLVSDGRATTRSSTPTMTVRATRLYGGPTEHARRAPTVGLEPGETLVLGPTGDGIVSSPSAASAGLPKANANAGSGNGYAAGAYGGGINPNAVNTNVPIDPNNTLVGSDGLARVPSSTDLSRAQAAQNPIGPNGFPVTGTGAPTVIGPDGTPTLAPGVAGSGTPVIGPNGTPVMNTGAPPVQIGPNGTPVLAQPGQAGAQPVIGPNGTPVLAQPGEPGSAPPNIGPNGTPVIAQPGQPGSAPPSIAPNGTPSSAPAGMAPSGSGSPSGSGPGNGS